jgi:hypothetical protein
MHLLLRVSDVLIDALDLSLSALQHLEASAVAQC